jgi:hypothetical protein
LGLAQPECSEIQPLFAVCLRWEEDRGMPDIQFIQKEIERMRVQVQRQRREIMKLQRAGISTASAETLLQRMLNKIDDLCAERDRLRR